MKRSRRNHSPKFKTPLALEALRGDALLAPQRTHQSDRHLAQAVVARRRTIRPRKVVFRDSGQDDEGGVRMKRGRYQARSEAIEWVEGHVASQRGQPNAFYGRDVVAFSPIVATWSTRTITSQAANPTAHSPPPRLYLQLPKAIQLYNSRNERVSIEMKHASSPAASVAREHRGTRPHRGSFPLQFNPT